MKCRVNMLSSTSAPNFGLGQVTIVCLFALHHVFCASIPSSSSSPGGSDKPSIISVDISDNGKRQHVSDIISALEGLNVLASDKQQCYNLDKITKTQEENIERTWKVGIHLDIREVITRNGKTVTADGGQPKDPAYSNTADPDKGAGREGGECLLTSSNSDQGASGGPVNRAQPAPNESEEVGGNLTSSEGVRSNLTAGAPDSPDAEDDRNGGLSKTQILVISTCSTVIGVFFIVALIMRIRNYLKRVRDEQATRKLAYRSSSVAMRGSLDGRKDSLQNSKTDTKDLGYEITHIDDDKEDYKSSHVAPGTNDTRNPLLIVTSPSVNPPYSAQGGKKRKNSAEIVDIDTPIEPICFFDGDNTSCFHQLSMAAAACPPVSTDRREDSKKRKYTPDGQTLSEKTSVKVHPSSAKLYSDPTGSVLRDGVDGNSHRAGASSERELRQDTDTTADAVNGNIKSPNALFGKEQEHRVMKDPLNGAHFYIGELGTDIAASPNNNRSLTNSDRSSSETSSLNDNLNIIVENIGDDSSGNMDVNRNMNYCPENVDYSRNHLASPLPNPTPHIIGCPENDNYLTASPRTSNLRQPQSNRIGTPKKCVTFSPSDELIDNESSVSSLLGLGFEGMKPTYV